MSRAAPGPTEPSPSDRHGPFDAGPFRGRRIIVGVTGGIAAYKTCTVVSRLAQAGAEVTVAMTPGATRFVTPLTFQALSARPVYTSAWQHVEAHDPQHIALAAAAHAAIVAPCSMDALARLAGGRADDVVSLILAAIDRRRTPVLLAPAMNTAMWEQPATRRNLRAVVEDGFTIVGPGDGWQACREVGPGRMSEPDEILAALSSALAARQGPVPPPASQRSVAPPRAGAAQVAGTPPQA